MPKKNPLFIALAAAIVIAIGLAGYFGWRYFDLKNSPAVVNDATTKRLLEKVGKLYSLPSDETPTVAQVKDKGKLTEQPFFAKAENGDYILIYTNARLALLYREKENKLINVGPITVQDQQAAAAQTAPAPTPGKVTVKVINGTTTAGRAAAVGAELTKELGEKVTVDSNYGNAKSRTMSRTVVVDVNGNKSAQAQEIASAISGQIGSLPAGESKPDADILIIAGP